jgi:hypothetical protein
LGFDVNSAAGDWHIIDIPPCKAGAPAQMFPDSELMVCDNTVPAHNGMLMVPTAEPFYNIACLRSIKPFDFVGRTGTIAFDVDAVSTYVTGHWISVNLTEDPVPTPNEAIEHAGTPRNGIILCTIGSNVAGKGSFLGYRYDNHQQVQLFSGSSDQFSVAAGQLNHFEVRISSSHLEVWASDPSTDGVTYPNFRKIISCDTLNLPFTRGYVSFASHNHATEKYFSVETSVHYWDNLGFDGPSVATDRFYPVPNSLTPPDATHRNTGYILQGGTAQGMYTCCTGAGASTGPIAPFVLKNVDLTGATSAILALNATYFYLSNLSTVSLRYRLNGGAWRDNLLNAEEIALLSATNPSAAGLKHALPVALADLKQGDNTLEFSSVNAQSTLMKVVNIGLVIKTDGSTGLESGRLPTAIGDYRLSAANGMNETIIFSVGLRAQQRIGLSIYDVSGKLVYRLVEQASIPAGETRMTWDGKNSGGRNLGAGIYYAKMEIGKDLLSARLVKSK